MVLRLKSLIVISLIYSFIFSFSILMPSGLLADEQQQSIHFDKQDIKIGKKKIRVEIAKTEQEHQYGLMNRNVLADDQGMLFIFENEQPLSFWMKNTYIDLAIAYIDKNKVIIDIQEMKATNPMMTAPPASYPSKKPGMYALEMNRGWFKKNKINKGQKLIFL